MCMRAASHLAPWQPWPPLPNTDSPLLSNHCTHFRHDSSSCLIPPAAIRAPHWKHRALCLTWLLGRWPITVDGDQRQMTMTSAALGIIIRPAGGLSSSVLWKKIPQLVPTSLVRTRFSANTSDQINKSQRSSEEIARLPLSQLWRWTSRDLHVRSPDVKHGLQHHLCCLHVGGQLRNLTPPPACVKEVGWDKGF